MSAARFVSIVFVPILVLVWFTFKNEFREFKTHASNGGIKELK